MEDLTQAGLVSQRLRNTMIQLNEQLVEARRLNVSVDVYIRGIRTECIEHSPPTFKMSVAL